MDFEFNDEQKMFRNMAREFTERHVKPHVKEVEKEKRFFREVLVEAAPLGLLGITAPQEYGGLQADRISYCCVLEEIAKVSTTAATIVGVQNSFSETPILEWGTPEQKNKYIPRLIRGEILGCLGVTEPNHGSDPASMETMAIRDGNGWVVNGAKMFTTGAVVADICTTAAQTDRSLKHRGIFAFVVEKGTPGFNPREVPGTLGLHGFPTSEISFQNCRVPDENMLGKVGDGFKVFMSGLDDARLLVCAVSVGIAQGCIDACIEYAQQRQQFGKPIGNFQLIQAKVADMVVEMEAARLLAYRAATLMDQGLRGRVETSYCKLFGSEMVQRVTYNAIQIHGGYGYIDEYPVERHFRDARALTIVEGTSDIHRLSIGRHHIGINAFV
ncbi:MAG: acyl-CoA dehydrogenase family protein [Chloroflexota bacterium]